MNTNELREKFLEFFESKGHTRCPSDVLVPTWDPSVLFTPAGMNQFKDHFLGKVKLDFTRAATSQKCLRTGDIENVGRTAYHHTFFEMLGNFSFGDYFKRDSISWAWEFLTEKKWLGLDPDRLTVSVYLDDDEAAEIWGNDVGLKANVIERMGEKDNFWPAGAPSEGPDGVCGPCSEIFYLDNFGEEVEIWNLVFTQFNRVGEPPDNLRALPSKNIDTGMGLERAAACLQGVETNYHIDILRPILEAVSDVCGVEYVYRSENGRRLRRITDHLRACTMAIHENVYPGAQKEKYVIRRLLRRAVLDGHQMGLDQPFLHQIVPAVVEQMTVPYPDLAETTERVVGVIKNEEANFFDTIDAGLVRIEKVFTEMKSQGRTTVDGAAAADLYQTYGFPPEVFEALAAESNLAFDWEGYQRAMDEHRERTGTVAHVVMGESGNPIDAIKKAFYHVDFVGYERTESEAELKFIVAGNHPCDHLQDTDQETEVITVLDCTPFYGESGGQVGDSGEIIGDHFRFVVTDTQKDGDLILHMGQLVEGQMRTGDRVTARVDVARRQGIRRAHSATHILHHSLQEHLGSHAQQQGSKVDDDWLRFDFTNMTPVPVDTLRKIEMDSHQKITEAEPIAAQILPLPEARSQGAMMLFGEKYPDPVRMVSMGDFSRELCGGTHLDNTSDVGILEIISEEGVSAGTRRILAYTGEKARQHVQQLKTSLESAADLLGTDLAVVPVAAKALSGRIRDLKKQLSGSGKTPVVQETPRESGKREMTLVEKKAALQEAARILNVALFDVPQRIEALQAEVGKLEQQQAEQEKMGPITADDLLSEATEIGGVQIVVAEARGANPNVMRQLIDQLRKRVSPVAVLLGASQGADKVTLVAGLSRELVEQGHSAG
ncbi:MAG: alanine--tRNA ligase, partial [Planctomycetaceae bacterium]|nr:alanine--tRNA ligase [Planctomycetaceae bacterium]